MDTGTAYPRDAPPGLASADNKHRRTKQLYETDSVRDLRVAIKMHIINKRRFINISQLDVAQMTLG